MSNAKQPDAAHGTNNDLPQGTFHQWRAMGGKLVPVRQRMLSRMPPQKSQTLYPYLLTGKLTNESEGVKWYAFVTIAAGILLVVLWARWLNDRMGGGSRRDTGPAPLVQLTTDATGQAVVHFQFWAHTRETSAWVTIRHGLTDDIVRSTALPING